MPIEVEIVRSLPNQGDRLALSKCNVLELRKVTSMMVDALIVEDVAQV